MCLCLGSRAIVIVRYVGPLCPGIIISSGVLLSEIVLVFAQCPPEHASAVCKTEIKTVKTITNHESGGVEIDPL